MPAVLNKRSQVLDAGSVIKGGLVKEILKVKK